MSKVSVIIPVYNAEKHLPECLDSIINQTFQNIEIICIDDGSIDSSLSILREYAAKDNRFIILTQDHAFAGPARNLGIRNASGKYLLFLDSDDRFHPEMIKTVYEKAEKKCADICVFPAEGFDNQSGKAYPMPWTCQPTKLQQDVFSGKDDPDHIFSFTTPAPWNKLFRREFVIENALDFQDVRNANDLAFILTALAAAEKIITINNKPLMQYRTNNSDSLQGSPQKASLAFYDALLELRKRLRARNLFDYFYIAFMNEAASVIFYNLHSIHSAKDFEELYYYIKNTILPELGLPEFPVENYYVFPDWKLGERIHVMLNESILEYAARFKIDLPDVKGNWYRRKTLRDMIKMNLEWIRTKK